MKSWQYSDAVFMSRFDKFKSGEVSSEEVEDGVCCNAKNVLEEVLVCSLSGSEDVNTLKKLNILPIYKCKLIFNNYSLKFCKYKYKPLYTSSKKYQRNNDCYRQFTY